MIKSCSSPIVKSPDLNINRADFLLLKWVKGVSTGHRPQEGGGVVMIYPSLSI